MRAGGGAIGSETGFGNVGSCTGAALVANGAALEVSAVAGATVGAAAALGAALADTAGAVVECADATPGASPLGC